MLRCITTLSNPAAPYLSFFVSLKLWSWMILNPTKNPIADIPRTRMNAGIRTAHSRAGNQACIGLVSLKTGYHARCKTDIPNVVFHG